MGLASPTPILGHNFREMLMARDIDRLIDHVEQAEYLPPIMRRVVVNRLDVPPTDEELERAKAEVYPTQ